MAAAAPVPPRTPTDGPPRRGRAVPRPRPGRVAGALTALAFSFAATVVAFPPPPGDPVRREVDAGYVRLPPGSVTVVPGSGGHALAVAFVGGCGLRYVPQVAERADAVSVRVRQYRAVLPPDVECTLSGHDRVLTVPLAAPLGDRTILRSSFPNP